MRRALNTLGLLVLTATAWASHKVNLSWAAVPGASGYDVYRASRPGGPYDRVAVTKEPAYTDTLEAGQTRYYVTTSVSKAGTESAKSREIKVTAPTP